MLQVLFVFSVGAFLGLFYDSLHCYWDVLSYATPHFWKESLWVPLEFGVAALAYFYALSFLPPSFKKILKQDHVPLSRLALDGALLFFAYLSNGLLLAPWGDPKTWANMAILFGLGLIGLLTRKPGKSRILVVQMTLVMMVVGPLTEASFSSLGLFAYTHADWSGVPYWLPLLWMVAAQLFYSGGVWLLKNRVSKALSTV